MPLLIPGRYAFKALKQGLVFYLEIVGRKNTEVDNKKD